MSELEKRKELSRYDSMTTEELQEILRKHAHGKLETELDTQELFEIMEVLSVRRQQTNPQAFRSDEEAFTEFCEHYIPKGRKEARHKIVHFPNRFFKTVAAVLTMVIILAVGTTLTAEAFQIDIWGKLANWSKEIFHFTDTSEGTTATNPEQEYNAELKSLQDALNDDGIKEKLVPTWMPEGYKSKDLKIMSSPRSRNINAIYEKSGSELVINIRQMIGVQADQIEKSEGLLEIYTVNDVDYYIFSNNANLQAAWSIGEFECLITGKITLEEMKAMIDSI